MTLTIWLWLSPAHGLLPVYICGAEEKTNAQGGHALSAMRA